MGGWARAQGREWAGEGGEGQQGIRTSCWHARARGVPLARSDGAIAALCSRARHERFGECGVRPGSCGAGGHFREWVPWAPWSSCHERVWGGGAWAHGGHTCGALLCLAGARVHSGRRRRLRRRDSTAPDHVRRGGGRGHNVGVAGEQGDLFIRAGGRIPGVRTRLAPSTHARWRLRFSMGDAREREVTGVRCVFRLQRNCWTDVRGRALNWSM